MSQSGAPPAPASCDQLPLPSLLSEEKSPSRGWIHQEVLLLIQDDRRHEDLDRLLGRLIPEQRAKLFEHRFEHELQIDEQVGDVWYKRCDTIS